MKVKDIIKFINLYADEKMAMANDNCGLQVGHDDHEVQNILVSVDVTDEVVDEANENSCNMIISHHPLLYRAVKTITNHDAKGKMITKLIKHDISVYSSHTCFDVSPYGMNAYIAKELCLKDMRFLDDWAEYFLKLEIYVPKENAEELRNAIYEQGAGSIGEYKNCSYSLTGEGMFTPTENAQPYIGTIEQKETTSEIKIEVLCPKQAINRIIAAIHKVHPYECPVYHVIEIKHTNSGIGAGIIGDIEHTVSAENFIDQIKKLFNCNKIKLTNNYVGRKISTVALCSGSGAEYLLQAKRMGADVMITSDCKWSDYLNAVENDLMVISPTHFESEYSFIQLMSKLLKKYDNNIHIIESKAKDIEVII